MEKFKRKGELTLFENNTKAFIFYFLLFFQLFSSLKILFRSSKLSLLNKLLNKTKQLQRLTKFQKGSKKFWNEKKIILLVSLNETKN